MKQAQKMQKDLQEAQEKVAQVVVEGSAGGEAVVIQMRGDYSIVDIKIDPELLEEDVDMLQDMIKAAFNNGFEKVKKETDKHMGSLGAGGMPGMPGLF